MAVSLSVPPGRDEATDPGNTAVYVAPTPDGPGCWLPEAAFAPIFASVTGRGKDPASCAGRLLAGSMESPELAVLSFIIIVITEFRLSGLDLEFFS